MNFSNKRFYDSLMNSGEYFQTKDEAEQAALRTMHQYYILKYNQESMFKYYIIKPIQIKKIIIEEIEKED